MISFSKLHSLILIVFLQACGSATETVTTDSDHLSDSSFAIVLTPEQQAQSGIRLDTPALRPMGGLLEVNGVLDVPPQNRVAISTAFAGFVQQTEVLQGTRVKKWQILARLDHPDFLALQQEYAEVWSQQDYLEAEWKRQQELAEGNATARRDFELAKSQWAKNKARVAGLEARLKMMGISPGEAARNIFASHIALTSPIDGFVTRVNTHRGVMVQPGAVLYEIADTRHLHAEIRVYERDLNRIQVGQEVEIRMANETRDRHAHIYLIGKEVEEDRTVRVHCHFEEDSDLVPGLYLKARIVTDPRLGSAVPEDALVSSEGRNWIFVADPTRPNQFEPIPVAISPNGSGWVPLSTEVLSRIGGRKVVIGGTFSLLSAWKGAEGGHEH